MRAILDEAAREAGVDVHDLQNILRALHAWSDNDVKVTSLKELQGRIWVEGFESSGIRGHLYPDAIDALNRFHDAGVRMYIYSSGSVAAQKLLFGHSVAGDLLPLFSGFYDTTIGAKREASSYERIVRELDVAPNDVIFFSDNIAELDAAREAGLQTVQLARPEDGTVPATAHTSVESFFEIVVLP
jgi:enolase-phosphatase E1